MAKHKKKAETPVETSPFSKTELEEEIKQLRAENELLKVKPEVCPKCGRSDCCVTK